MLTALNGYLHTTDLVLCAFDCPLGDTTFTVLAYRDALDYCVGTGTYVDGALSVTDWNVGMEADTALEDFEHRKAQNHQRHTRCGRTP